MTDSGAYNKSEELYGGGKAAEIIYDKILKPVIAK
jgi:hypothetical protein